MLAQFHYFQPARDRDLILMQMLYSSRVIVTWFLFQLRNPTDTFKFATVKNSAIEEYFKRQVEFTTMYRTMENQNLNTVEEAIFAVENGQVVTTTLLGYVHENRNQATVQLAFFDRFVLQM